jgi:hypothetical protein
MKSRVLLVHGLWMHAPALYFWKKELRKAGFEAEYFSYKSMLQSPELAFARLRTLALARPNTHILAHSLGGLIAVNALASSEFKGQIICVGTPLAGSQVVRHYATTALGSLAGRSAALLCAGLTHIPEGLQVSVIAGTKPKGLGQLFHRFSEPNDGSVALSETQIPGLAQHVTVCASHSGQLFSDEVVNKAIELLSVTPKP